MKYGDQVANDRYSVCNLFSSFFQSEFPKCDAEIAVVDMDADYGTDDAEVDIIFSTDDVKNVLKGFDKNKVSSPDDIPMMFYKNLSQSLSLPLKTLFNKSLKERVFPDRWKTSFIMPIFKEGDKFDVSNYRAVSILCAISKVFEKLLFTVLFEKFKGLIHPSQHFFTKRSTQMNLMEFVTSVSQSIAKGGQVNVFYTDFSKAFDRIDHGILLKKLATFGFDNSLIKWFQSYLSNRSQFDSIGCGRSERITPTAGVPQGSVLGPFLFIIFINDLLQSLHTSFGFADDLKGLKGHWR